MAREGANPAQEPASERGAAEQLESFAQSLAEKCILRLSSAVAQRHSYEAQAVMACQLEVASEECRQTDKKTQGDVADRSVSQTWL